jgi:hypothetical protein
MTEKVYHIYAKDKCLFHSLKEEEFRTTWNTVRALVGLMRTDYQVNDITYEELLVNKMMVGESSY